MMLVKAVLSTCLLAAFWVGAAIPSQASQAAAEARALAVAVDEMTSGEWDAALRAADRAGPLARDIIDWHRFRAGLGSFDEVRSFLERRSDWPGLQYLRRKSEGTVPYRARPEDVVAFFDEVAPQTGAGLIVLAAAHETLGNKGPAEAALIEAWRNKNLSTNDESYLLERYAALLKPHHEARLDMLLWEGQTKAAERLTPRVSKGWQALAQARIGLRRTTPGVDSLIEKVPANLQKHPGLAYERFLWRSEKGRRESAIELALGLEGTEEALGRPDKWSNMRRSLARWTMRNGDPKDAYALASAHGLTEGSHFADLEWLSGYLALTYLDDAERALAHFRTFATAVVTPISLGRAGYWEGRALEALGRTEEAQAAYRKGGVHQTSFYGQLAAEKAGMPMDPGLTGAVKGLDWTDAPFTTSSVYQAGVLLLAAGEKSLGERFLTHLAESLTEVEVAQLAEYALAEDDPHLALMIAKRAATRGIVVPRAYFPIADLGLDDMPVPTELALAIARRESEFDPGVRSGAGAVGLMQVMPGTAREVAGWLNVEYDRNRLLEDPVYNARLGVTYLSELRSILGGNFALVAAGYNAGPGRPVRWIDEYWDPRDPDRDAVDWVEHIPFRETRNYVMRVMESLPVYRARLTGEVQPLQLSVELKAD